MEDFVTTLLGERPRLKSNAVPSVFKWSRSTGQTTREKRFQSRKKSLDRSPIQEPGEIEMAECQISAYEEIELSCDHEHELPSAVVEYQNTGTQTDQGSILDINRVMCNPAAVLLFTSFTDRNHFNLVFAALGENRFQLQVFPLSPENCFLLTVMKLRTNKSDVELGLAFGISKNIVGQIFNVWTNFMYSQFKELNIWLDKKTVLSHVPPAFREKYPTTRVIIDATEVSIMKPKNPTAQQATFSNYKNCNTVKVLIGINPSGFICFISDAYGGAISDRQLFIRSGLLDLLEEGDAVMADRGFNIQDLLCVKGVSLNIPPFLKGKKQFSPSENIETRRIASNRIHVERAIGLGKTYKILQSKLQYSKIRLSSRIIFVCYMLCNFRKSIMKEH
ncbi:uncharacterized protein [Periplaneta americana]|uniref:uncharacterized protein n=1 Tax=Periplaneta americana TaxID=6978 RepID=UPI0037E7DFA3